MSGQTNTMSVTYGDFTIDFATVPHASLMAMLRRGVSHFFGSEQASKVTAKFDPDADEPIADTPEARADFKAECQAKAHAALLAGTVGVSVRGPAVDPITKIIRRLAKKEVSDILAKNGIKAPKKADETVQTPDGASYTMDTLIDRRLATHGERLGKEAKKEQDEAARKAKKLAESVQDTNFAVL